MDLSKAILDLVQPLRHKEHDTKQWSCHHHHHILGFLHTTIASPPLKEHESIILH